MASNLGDPSAFSLLGEMYQNGYGVDIDLDKAATFYMSQINTIVKEITTDDKNTYPCDVYIDSKH